MRSGVVRHCTYEDVSVATVPVSALSNLIVTTLSSGTIDALEGAFSAAAVVQP